MHLRIMLYASTERPWSVLWWSALHTHMFSLVSISISSLEISS